MLLLWIAQRICDCNENTNVKQVCLQLQAHCEHSTKVKKYKYADCEKKNCADLKKKIKC